MAVDILLATYNGEKFLQQQIDSLLQQTYTDWYLLVRDDASTDRTSNIILNYVKKYPNKIKFIQDNHRRLGASQNFTQLLEHSSNEYIMFCDQDDIWLPDKIELSLQKIQELEKQHGTNSCLLIHTDLQVVDSDLKLINKSFWQYQNLDPQEDRCLNRLLIQNVVTGCTIAINRALKNKLLPIPNEAIMHDWWIVLVAASFGFIERIDTPTLLYRQHINNDIGARKWGLNYITSRLLHLDKIQNYFQRTTKQAAKFLETYDRELQTIPETNFTIQTYINLTKHNFFFKRFLLIKHGYYQTGSLRNLGLFLVI